MTLPVRSGISVNSECFMLQMSSDCIETVTVSVDERRDYRHERHLLIYQKMQGRCSTVASKE
jgi:hypothetical protein